MNSMIEDLFHGSLNPSGKSSPEADELLDLIVRHETWLAENLDVTAKEVLHDETRQLHLDETAKEVLDKLTDCHVEYDGITAWESFRRGFALGARLVMEVVYGAEAGDG